MSSAWALRTFFKKTELEYKRRLEICKQCDEYIPNINMCGVCKCFISAKARIKKQTCPLGKW